MTWSFRQICPIILLLIAGFALTAFQQQSVPVGTSASDIKFKITIPEGARNEATTGRVFILINDTPEPTPREVAFMIRGGGREPKMGHVWISA